LRWTGRLGVFLHVHPGHEQDLLGVSDDCVRFALWGDVGRGADGLCPRRAAQERRCPPSGNDL